MRYLLAVGAIALLPACDSKNSADTGGAWGDEPATDSPSQFVPSDDESPLGDTAAADTADTAAPDPSECDDTTAVTLYLSPDDSNSMSSPVQAREAVLESWSSLSRVSIRTWEFLNYYSFDYAPAEPGALALSAELAPDPDGGEGDYLFQIGVSSPQVSSADRGLMNITLVLDESGSMGGTPMELLKATSDAIAGSLKAGDVVSMVTWDTSNATVLDSHIVSGPDDPTLLAAIDGISSGGGTDLHGGLQAGYALAQENFDATRINRVVLISDGGANAGVTDIDLIASAAGSEGEDGVYMVGVGVGTATSYNDELMNEVTDAGKGASVFIPSAAEAEAIFGERFVSTMDVAARDVQVRLELPPGFEIVNFSGEEYSGDPAQVEPQNIAPSDAMVFYQSLSTCAPELMAEDTEIGVTARYLDPISFAQQEVSQTWTVAELMAGQGALLAKGGAVFGYAEALIAYKAAEDDAGRAEAVAGAQALVLAAQVLNPGDADLDEIQTVLDAL